MMTSQKPIEALVLLDNQKSRAFDAATGKMRLKVPFKCCMSKPNSREIL